MYYNISMQEISNFNNIISKAKEIQNSLAAKVKIFGLKHEIHYVAGADAAITGNTVIAAVCLFTYPQLEKVDESIVTKTTDFPYIPGFLSFRESPALIEAITGLKHKPDAIIVDGQGIAHPRRIGIASHIGVLLDTVTIGAAKSRLIGRYEEPLMEKYCRSVLFDGKERIGAVLRSRTGVKPLFISPGHLIDIDGAVEVVLNCLSRYRLPQPTHCAHNAAAAFKRKMNLTSFCP